ncbi:hypothetical protein [Luteimonas kalidii]|uniref:Uncharacterized protein n=1 Tax=Luteimonas kalidii TaxID=3042025 RepID=A0ABT6JU60_9GAMM|nr:hypothetical protein [Luteimonas kalidii]MDH5834233.1 hypothetical protein [Luteimonas kalidii]
MKLLAGGYKIYFTSGGKRISGVGTTATTAGVNGLAFGQLEATTGDSYMASTYTDGVVQVAGGYVVKFVDGSAGVTGAGNTLTDAGENGVGFAALASESGRNYNLSLSDSANLQSFSGGYLMQVGYSLGSKVSGVGSNLSDAADIALGFAELVEQGGRRCTLQMSDISIVLGAFNVSYRCSSRIVQGTGATATDAGLDALTKAQAL